MRTFAAAAAVVLGATPVLAQANANLAPGGIVDGAMPARSSRSVRSAEGTAPDGRPAPGGRQGEGQQAATSGSKMVKQGDSGANPPSPAETPNKP